MKTNHEKLCNRKALIASSFLLCMLIFLAVSSAGCVSYDNDEGIVVNSEQLDYEIVDEDFKQLSSGQYQVSLKVKIVNTESRYSENVVAKLKIIDDSTGKIIADDETFIGDIAGYDTKTVTVSAVIPAKYLDPESSASCTYYVNLFWDF